MRINDALIEKFAKNMQLRGMMPKTCESYVFTLRKFDAHLGGKSLLAVGNDELEAWLYELRIERKLKAASLQAYFAALSTFYDFLVYNKTMKYNPVPAFRKWNLTQYKKVNEITPRKLITIEEFSRLVNVIANSRDRAIIFLLAATGARRHEISELDVGDIDTKRMCIRVKETPKRTNRLIPFCDEAAEALLAWLDVRNGIDCQDDALFVSDAGLRLQPVAISKIVVTHATRSGLCLPGSGDPNYQFGAHWLRHFFTARLRMAGMPREHINELRGDARKDSMSPYEHILEDELIRSYRVYFPSLGT